MKRLRRALSVVVAYLCAAIVGVAVFLTYGYLSSSRVAWSVSDLVLGFSVFVPMAVIFALPVALPVILLSELKKIRHWALFTVAGLVLGALLTAALTEIPYRGFNVELALLLTIACIASAMTYWLIAFCTLRMDHGVR